MPIIENSSGDDSLGNGLTKNKLGTDMLGLLSPKTSLNLSKGLVNVSWSNGFAPWGVVRWQRKSAAVVLLVIEKIGSQVFLLSSTPLMPPYIVKMTGLAPKCLSHRGFYFYLVPSEFGGKISHFSYTVGEKMLYRAKTFCYDIFSKNFKHLQLS
jgi:hypothetical protein